MPQSLKQLDQRYKAVCDSIKDAQAYTVQHLQEKIQVDIPTFYASLGQANLEEVEANIDMMEEVLNQCKVAIRHEKTRRSLEGKIVRLTNKQTLQDAVKTRFQLTRRADRLSQAIPYGLPKQPSISQ